MPYEWTIDATSRTAYLRGWGRPSHEENLRAPHDMVNDPAFDRSYGVVIDVREVDSDPTPDQVMEFSRNTLALRPLRRVAVLVNEGAAKATEISAALTAASGFEFVLFDDLDEATRWAQEPGPTRPREADGG